MKPLTSKEYANTRHILNPEFRYVRESESDIRATFERVRAELEAAAEQPKKAKVRRIR